MDFPRDSKTYLSFESLSLGLKNEFESAIVAVNEPSVLESLKVYCVV